MDASRDDSRYHGDSRGQGLGRSKSYTAELVQEPESKKEEQTYAGQNSRFHRQLDERVVSEVSLCRGMAWILAVCHTH